MAIAFSVARSDPYTSLSLEQRCGVALSMLKSCRLCEFRCGTDRTRGVEKRCSLGHETYAYKRYVSLHEEPDVAPSLRIFLGGCNLRCRFCDESPDCLSPRDGCRVDPPAFAADLEETLGHGVRSVTLIGGEPTLHVHTILQVAAAASTVLPLNLDTNMYMTPEVLRLLDGVVRRYRADLKFGNDECAWKLAGVPRYSEVVHRNILYAASTTEVIVRHLLIPGHLDCCLRPVVDWVSTNLPDVRFQLYTGYVPCWQASDDPEIGRLNDPSEAQSAIDYVKAANLRCDARTGNDATCDLHSSTRRPTDMSITIGSDGRIYCHDLTPELASVLRLLCPDGARQVDPRQPPASMLGSRNE